MKAIPLIRGTQLEPYLTFLNTIGADSETLLEKSYLSPQLLQDQELLLPEYQVWDFIERAGRANGSALEFGLWTGLEGNFDFLLGLMYPSLTAYDALNKLSVNTRRHSSQASFWLTTTPTQVWFCRRGIPEIAVGQQAVEAYTLMLMINVVRYLIHCPQWQPTEICLQMKPTPTVSNFQSLQQTQIAYQRPFTAISIQPQHLNFPMASKIIPAVSAAPLRSELPQDFLSSLCDILRPLLGEKLLTLPTISQVTGISPRTLQRHLRASGTSFTQVVNQLKFESACCLMTESELSLGEISSQLGYSTPGHFHRAFKRWTGRTPQSFRHSQ